MKLFKAATTFLGMGLMAVVFPPSACADDWNRDRKSTRLNSSHEWISYAVFCLKKKKAIRARVDRVLTFPTGQGRSRRRTLARTTVVRAMVDGRKIWIVSLRDHGSVVEQPQARV